MIRRRRFTTDHRGVSETAQESQFMTTALLVNRVAETTARRDRDELDVAMTRLLLQFLDAQSVALFRLFDDGNIKRIRPRAAATHRQDETEVDVVNGCTALPALSDRPKWHECVTKNELVQVAEADGRLMTLFPIFGEREVVGVLAIRTAAALSVRDAELVQGILKILQNHLALLEYGERDTLTSLLNRKTFESHFHKLHKRLPRTEEKNSNTQESSWLALIDIDKFKSINDNFGHLFGDEVLLLSSQLMQRNFRGADQLFRFGGEEFLVVLDEASSAGAHVALERLRATIAAYDYPQVGRVTVSIGYTQVTANDISTTCVERADAALYHVKSHGRNGIGNYETLVSAGALAPKSDESDIVLF